MSALVVVRTMGFAVMLWLVYVSTYLPVAASSRGLKLFVTSSFRCNRSLYHLTLDEILGKLYVGGADRIYQLDWDLNLEVAAVSGPDLEDNNKTNHNKILLTFEHHLLTCGTGFQGTCQTRELRNISNVTYYPIEVARRVCVTEENLSTVAFIANSGPFRVQGLEVMKEQNALYVGMSYTGEAELPSVCSRQLIDDRWKFQIFRHDMIKPFVKVTSETEAAASIIYFKTGFSHEGFSYFLTVQGHTGKRYSRIIRICQHDAVYKSYIEVDLECSSVTGELFREVQDAQLVRAGSFLSSKVPKTKPRKDEYVLLAVFSNGLTDSRAKSAMCVFPMADIQRKIIENIVMCYNGTEGNFKPKHLEVQTFGDKGCVSMGEEWKKVNESFCGSDVANRMGLNYPLQGISPITAQAASIFDTTLSAVTGTSTNNVTVAITGDTDGNIRKFTIEDLDESYEYHKLQIEPGLRIESDLLLDLKGKYIFAITNESVTKMKVWVCEQYTDCEQCLASRDPHCGWCALENKCSLRQECQRSDQPLHWLWYGMDVCIQITDVSPDKTPRQEQALVQVNVTNLPTLPVSEEYFCVFGQNASPAALSPYGLSCESPPLNAIPDYDTDNLRVDLMIRYGRLGIDFLFTDFYFFTCDRLKSCGACVSSLWSCDWCIYDNICTYNSSVCQRTSSYIISGINNPDAFMNQGSDQCPNVNSGGREILLPHGVEKSIELKGRHLPPSDQNTYECLLQTSSNPRNWKRIPAERTNAGLVTCQLYKYRYDEQQESISYNLTVAWAPNCYLESNVSVTLYKCSFMGRDCSQCLSPVYMKAKYECTWCKHKCEYRSSCVGLTAQSCPKPVIDSFSPLTGPWEGGTTLTIIGSNLGKRFEDITGGGAILVLGRKCTPFPDLYQISRKIVCLIGPKNKDVISDSAVVVVRLASQLEGKSRRAFQFQNPRVLSIFPAKGPKSGGSRVTIMGSSLQTGNTILVYIGNFPCLFHRNALSNTSVKCTTIGVDHSQILHVISMTFDGVYRNLTQRFDYTEDPTITGLKPLKSFAGGGRVITVTGTNLFAIQQPKMFLISENWKSNKTLCHVESDSVMKCPSPRFPVEMLKEITSTVFADDAIGTLSRKARQMGPSVGMQTVNIGFIMDGVESVHDVSRSFPNTTSEMTYVPNPECCSFPEYVGTYEHIGERLVLKGNNLREAVDENDILVYIGKEVCNVTSLVQSELSCIPPDKQPDGHGDNELPIVMVTMGNLEFIVGYLRYKVYDKSDFPNYGIYATIAAAGVLLITIVIILIICKQRSSVKAKRFRTLLDDWERKVRDECKQAFAELQTDMTDLTSDLNLTGVPYWDYRMYVFKVLFPGSRDHPVMHEKETLGSHRSHTDSAMMQFNQLVVNKNFLITLIRTLEQQKSFSIRDKANVAALLMVIMQDKMEYATDVVKDLLFDLIDKSLERKTPKLMFRRTESVIEKMVSNWLSLCLYQHLLDYVGKPLFMLFKAVKQQVEKGPVDAITSEARYSLSMDKLLREKIEPISMTLNVALADETVQCKVLDVDSITQVKEKLLDTIYKNQPFSKRESVHDLDLEWRGGRSGHLCLQDDDITNNVDSLGWKKINTLAHYKVPDCAVVALVPRQHDSLTRPPFNGLGLNGNLGVSMSSITPIMQDSESGKVYHLVRQQEDASIHDRGHKVISELLLPRLLATKGTLQQFVDDLFKAILSVDELPIAVKYIFDFLDEAAEKNHIDDPEVVVLWKSNLLPLRFWVNMIKNPNFVFDIHKPNIVDSCLSVIAQTFMDSCSTSEHKLGKDSPANKLLYAKDIPAYRKMVAKYYSDIATLQSVSDQEMNIYLVELSKNHPTDFNVIEALTELYEYVQKYHDEVAEALHENPATAKEAQKLEQIRNSLELETTSV